MVFRADIHSRELASAAPAPETDPGSDLDHEELDVDRDELAYEDELAESRATSARGGFWAGFREGL